MVQKIQSIWDWLLESFQLILGGLFSNAVVVIGFFLAIVIILRIFREQRRPSSIFAWSFFILLTPPLGVPLYFIFGGRKLKKKIKTKGLLTQAADSAPSIYPVCDQFDSAGNKVRFQMDGQIAFHNFCRAINEADREIHILTYILANDEVGKEILQLLTEKARQGVHVRLLVDALGSFRRPKKEIARLKEAGGEVFTFMPAFPFQTHGWANLRNHRKIAVFDNRKCILGGRNLDTRFMGSNPDTQRFYDLGATYEGPVVEYLNGIFISDWAFASKQSLNNISGLIVEAPNSQGQSKVSGIASGPDVEGDLLYERLVNIIQEFNEELIVVTPYFIPDEVLLRSLIVKAHRGKRITLVLPEKSNWALVDFARTQYLRELHQAGVKIQLFTEGMVHAKLVLSDRKLVLHGSANFDIRSLFVNFEIGMIHTSLEDIEPIIKWLDWLCDRCRPFGNQRELNPPKVRKIFEEAARLIAPLL
ncbi:MAG: phospholipase D-like domain-containing protein [Verrucomicrobia bacterium]|nr:phospholipase D-like domain-containing protein [Verrucomicrobiota bacterium]MDA1069301.1 phospholipase D-like domain-containing protein [Verrucomicrobiota bacterium]